MLVIGLAAPVVSVVDQDLAPVAGAIAGVWIFFGRTILQFLQAAKTTAAAATQELFDFYVFGMPSTVQRSTVPSVETIAEFAGPDGKIDEAARKQKLLAWYPFRDQDAGVVSVAVAQRANASYTDRLLQSTVTTWAILTTVWVIALVGVGVAAELSLGKILVGVLMPVLPAFLDVVEYVLGIQKSKKLRRDLVRTIEERLRETSRPVEPTELLVWQDTLYDLRRTTPQVPNFVYWLHRKKNKQAMESAAAQIGDEVNGGNP